MKKPPIENIEDYLMDSSDTSVRKLYPIFWYFLHEAPGIRSKLAPAEKCLPPEVMNEIFTQHIEGKGEIEIGSTKVVSFDQREGREVVFSQQIIKCVRGSNETKFAATLRHLRNAIAHGNIYIKHTKSNTYICFLDFKSKVMTGKIVTTYTTLRRWRDYIKAVIKPT